MIYAHTAIANVPAARDARDQHLLDTYASETNKTWTVWTTFAPEQLDYRPHEKSSSVRQILEHQLLSERRFFGEFLGLPEPAAAAVLPGERTPRACAERLVDLARPRLAWLAERDGAWWQERVPFFDVERERAWIFWRRVLHTAHHRTQLTVYQRLLGIPVEPTYGPTADVSWTGADPTLTVEAAERKR